MSLGYQLHGINHEQVINESTRESEHLRRHGKKTGEQTFNAIIATYFARIDRLSLRLYFAYAIVDTFLQLPLHLCGLIFHFWKMTKGATKKKRKKDTDRMWSGFFVCCENNPDACEVSVENFTVTSFSSETWMDVGCAIQNASRSYHLKELCVGYVCCRCRHRRVC